MASQPRPLSSEWGFRARYLEHLQRIAHVTEYMSPSRRFWNGVLSSTTMELVLFFPVLLSIIELVVLTDDDASGVQSPSWIGYVSYLATTCFATEMVIRIYVHRCAMIYSIMHMLDFAVVLADIIMVLMALASSSDDTFVSPIILRVFRLARLGRAARFLRFFPELYIISAGIVRAVKAMLCGVVLVYVWLLVMSIVAVQVIYPISKEVAEAGHYVDCERCPRAFSSVWNSMMTFTQTLLAGDSWGQTTLPIIEREPLTYFYFMLVLTSVCLAIMNLILAAIVDAAQEARKKGDHEIALEKEKARLDASNHLVELCKVLDVDCSGSLTCNELKEGMDRNEAFSDCMLAMDCGPDDMDMVFSILDADKSGDVNYEEFATELHRMKCDDSHTMLLFIKFYVKAMHDDVLKDMKRLFEGEFGQLKSQVMETKSDIILNMESVKIQNSKPHAVLNHPRIGEMDAQPLPNSFQGLHGSAWAAERAPVQSRLDFKSEVLLLPSPALPEHENAMGKGSAALPSRPLPGHGTTVGTGGAALLSAPQRCPSPSIACCTSFEKHPPQRASAQ